MSSIRVLLVDDHAVVREALKALLDTQADIQVVGEAGDGRQAVRLADELVPDVVIMDIVMPLMNGIEATRQIIRHHPAAKVLILSSHGEDDYMKPIAGSGAAGCILKVEAASELLRAVRAICSGQKIFPPAAARHLAGQDVAEGDGSDPLVGAELTVRELEVLQRIAEGKANKEMAFELNISIKTVEKHRQRVMDKLGIHDIAGLTRYAIAKGIIEVGTLP
jgi:DNA-binding NarL/FixJ family response regulator